MAGLCRFGSDWAFLKSGSRVTIALPSIALLLVLLLFVLALGSLHATNKVL